MLAFLVKSLVVYALACMVWSTIFVVRHLDELEKNSLTPGCPYFIFAAGIVWLILSSPFWVLKVISHVVANVIREIREIKV